jgi:hypothetical protein
MRTLIVVVATWIAACGPQPEPEPPPPPEGSVTLRFAVPNGVRQSPNLGGELNANIYGAIFLASQVTVFGPEKGATQFASIELENVDLREAAVSAESWTSEPLEVNRYSFLGFYDVNGNNAEDRDPDKGDPVTFPGTTDFDIVEDEHMEYTLEFVMVR